MRPPERGGQEKASAVPTPLFPVPCWPGPAAAPSSHRPPQLFMCRAPKFSPLPILLPKYQPGAPLTAQGTGRTGKKGMEK